MLNQLYSTMVSGSVFGLFLQIVPVTFLVGLIYAIYRYARIKRNGLAIQWGPETARLLFVLYLTGLVNLVLVPADLWTLIWSTLFIGYSHTELVFFSAEFNLVPTLFKLAVGEITIGPWVLKMMAYNFLMFVPLGFLLPFVSKRVTYRNIWLIAVAVPIAVEIIQPIVGRSFDVDDLILNFAGIVVGYLVSVGIKKPKRRTDN